MGKLYPSHQVTIPLNDFLQKFKTHTAWPLSTTQHRGVVNLQRTGMRSAQCSLGGMSFYVLKCHLRIYASLTFLVKYKDKIRAFDKINSILKYSHSVQNCGYGNNHHHSNMLL